MQQIQQIPIASIEHGPLPTNQKALTFAVHVRNGDIFPPIKVERVGDKFKLRGGRHRLAAHKMLGLETIRAKFGVKE